MCRLEGRDDRRDRALLGAQVSNHVPVLTYLRR
jgi:hypothetical protein